MEIVFALLLWLMSGFIWSIVEIFIGSKFLNCTYSRRGIKDLILWSTLSGPLRGIWRMMSVACVLTFLVLSVYAERLINGIEKFQKS